MSSCLSGWLTGQLSRFVFVGTVGASVDIGGTMLLVDVGWSPLAARLPALAAAIVTTWALHGAFTFRRMAGLTPSSLLRFAGIALAISGLNFLLYAAMVSAGSWPPLAIAIATGICMVISFFAYRYIAFR